MPQTSFIMSVYNREAYLAESIESVLNQTVQDFELILWDDASQDNSYKIAQQYATQDPRVKLFKSEENQGPARTFNLAVSKAEGELLGWVDSDDLLDLDALALTLAEFKRNKHIGMVYTKYRLINESSKVVGQGNRCNIPYSPEKLLMDFMTFHFRLFRKALFEQVGGLNETYRAAIDYDFCLKLSEVCTIVHLDKCLYSYRLHPATVSKSKRLEQLVFTYEAINAALKRRKMDDDMFLDMEINAKYYLRNKKQVPPDYLAQAQENVLKITSSVL